MRTLLPCTAAVFGAAAVVALLGAAFAQDRPGKQTATQPTTQGSLGGAFEHCAKVCNDCGRA
jgi:hypothetical protein